MIQSTVAVVRSADHCQTQPWSVLASWRVCGIARHFVCDCVEHFCSLLHLRDWSKDCPTRFTASLAKPGPVWQVAKYVQQQLGQLNMPLAPALDVRLGEQLQPQLQAGMPPTLELVCGVQVNTLRDVELLAAGNCEHCTSFCTSMPGMGCNTLA